MVRAKSAQRSHQMPKQQQDMRKTIANMERTRKNGSRNMFSIVGGYQAVAKIARDRTRTEQQIGAAIIFNEKWWFPWERKASNICERKSSNICERKSSNICERKSSNIWERKPSNIWERKPSNIWERKPSNHGVGCQKCEGVRKAYPVYIPFIYKVKNSNFLVRKIPLESWENWEQNHPRGRAWGYDEKRIIANFHHFLMV